MTLWETKLLGGDGLPLTYEVVDVSRGTENLVIIICGYKPKLWEFTLPRIAKYTDKKNVDICILCHGAPPERAQALKEIASQYGWSFLYSSRPRISETQNIAIGQVFRQAKRIAKLDEDIFVTDRWFEGLERTLQQAEADGAYDVGFVAPLLPVNGFGYRVYLQEMELVDAYREAFPKYYPAKSACMGVAAHYDPAVCEWLWQQSSPLDQTAERLRSEKNSYVICPHRFSIGAMMFQRALWEALGGFQVAGDDVLGVEETQLCNYCMENSKAIVVAKNVLCGHFAFGPQNARMYKLLEDNPNLFR